MRKIVLFASLALATFMLSAQERLVQTRAPQVNIMLEWEELIIDCWCEEEAVIHVLIDGEEVIQNSNYCVYSIPRTDEDFEVTVSVYAKAEGKSVSETIEQQVIVPAFEPYESTMCPIFYAEPIDEMHYDEMNETGYRKYMVYLMNDYDEDPNAKLYYRTAIRARDDNNVGDLEWSDWFEYSEPIYINDPDTHFFDAYAKADRKLESNHISWVIAPEEYLPYWAAYDFKENDIYYKILTDSTVSVSARTLDDVVGPESHTGNYSGYVVIPDRVEHKGTQYTVTKIDEMAFLNCVDLTGVTIPNTVTEIESMAFAFSSLTSIDIPASVVSIAPTILGSCTSLEQIRVDGNNPVYDSRDNCNAIIETGLNLLKVGCKNTVIPATVTAIGEEAFLCEYALTSIEIPNSVTSIGDYAFTGTSLASIEIPNSVITIGDNAFSGCGELTSVRIPNSVISIGDYIFSYCSSLTSLTIGNSVKHIGISAFKCCESLTSLTIGNSVSSIGEEAFASCNALTSIIIPDSVTTIGAEAFEACYNLQSMTIGSGVTSIGRYAFSSCYALTSITLRAITPPQLVNAFFYSNRYYEQATLYVPNESLAAYQAHEEWGKFTHIVPFIGAGPGDVDGDGSINITDVTEIIDMILMGDMPDYCDVDGDGMVSISDITALIDKILTGNY